MGELLKAVQNATDHALDAGRANRESAELVQPVPAQKPCFATVGLKLSVRALTSPPGWRMGVGTPDFVFPGFA